MSAGVFDSSLNPLEEARVLKRYNEFANKIYKQVHFSIAEVQTLLVLYYKIVKDERTQNNMTKDQFLEILHSTLDMTDTNMTDIVLTAVNKKSSNYISEELWLKTLSLFLRGNIEEQIKFCYTVYDIQGTGRLGKEIMFSHLKYSILSSSADVFDEESVRDLLDVIMKKMDVDRDGKISFEDYRTTVIKQPFLLQFMGPCLPERNAVNKFLTTLTYEAQRHI